MRDQTGLTSEPLQRTSPAAASATLKFACPRSKVALSFVGVGTIQLPILSLKWNGKRITVGEAFLDNSKLLSSLTYVSGECDQHSDRIVLSFSGILASKSIESVTLFLSVREDGAELDSVHCVLYAGYAKRDAPPICDQIWQYEKSF
jgi:hypothetical protein